MARTDFGTNDAQAVSIWSKLTFREALKATKFKKFLGRSKRAIIQRLEELEKNAGDTIKYDLLMQATGSGVTGDERLKGNEEALVYHQDSVVVNQLRHAHSFAQMSQQRTVHNLRMDAKENLADWWAAKLDDFMFRYLGGDTTLTHGQAGVAPDQAHYICAGDQANSGTIATDESTMAASSDELDLMDVDYAREIAEAGYNGSPAIRPCRVDGEDYYVFVMHPYCVTDVRVSTNSSATIKWSDVQQYANVRGLKNPLFTGSLGIYNNTILESSTRIYSPTSNIYRNVFLGAQAGVFAVGNAYKPIMQKAVGQDNLMSWYEEVDDYGNEQGVAAGMVFGMKACRFNSQHYGCIVVTAYSAAHNL